MSAQDFGPPEYTLGYCVAGDYYCVACVKQAPEDARREAVRIDDITDAEADFADCIICGEALSRE